MFTCWDTKRNTRPANLGSRIDYVLCSEGLKDWFIDSNIQEGLMGSDHCPVYGTMAETVKKEGTEMPLVQLMNPFDMFKDDKRVREWENRDALPLSAKLIPEFDRRRNIRDMFTRKSSQAASQSQSQASQTPLTETTQDEALGSEAGGNGSSSAETSSYFGNMHDMASLETDNLEKGSAAKRNAGAMEANAPPPAKKTKGLLPSTSGLGSGPGAGAGGPKMKAAAGQKTLQGFFKPKNAAAPAPASAGTDGRTGTQTQDQAQAQSAAASGRQTPPPGSAESNGAASQDKTPTKLPTEQTNKTMPAKDSSSPKATSMSTSTASPGKIFDPIENKESWSKLLGKRVVPKCEHNEPCISLVTKKPGVNCGK